MVLRMSRASQGALLLALLVGAAVVSAVEVERRHKRHHHDEEDDPDFVPPPPPPGFFHGFPPGSSQGLNLADFPRFSEVAAESSAAPSDDPSDLVKSLYGILAQKRDNTVEESSKIMETKVETEKKEAELDRQQAQLKKRAEMLTRLQFCLEQDAIPSQTTGAAAANAQAPAKPAAPAPAAPAAPAAQQQQGQAPTAADLNARAAELAKQEENLRKRVVDAENKERDLARREEALRTRIGQTDAEAKKVAAEAQQAQPAQKAAPQVKEVIKTVTVPGVCAGTCAANKNCATCTANSNCGWCGSTQTCQDVVQPGNKPANCTATNQWNYLFCKAETCEQHLDCRSCMADPECGRCVSTGKCQQGTLTGPSKGTCKNWAYAGQPFRVLSYNVYGRDASNRTARANTIFRLVSQANADFVTFQEVEDWFLEALSRQKWASNYYATDYGSGHAPGGLLILSKVPLDAVAYYEKTQPGQVEVDQRGRLLVARPKLGEGNLAIATTTLDWRSPDNRADTLDYIFSVLNGTSDVILTGDFNFDSGAMPETSRIPAQYQDVWNMLRPKQPGFTWDPVNNEYARTSDPRSKPSRIDRVFVNYGFNNIKSIEKIGSSGASPHYALLTTVEMFGAFC